MIRKEDIKQQDENIKRTEYPENEDVFAKDEIVPLDENGEPLDIKESDAEDDIDLDVPGAELDDENELIGEEDEENNYWSLGGDNHDDLEENND